MYLDRRTFVLGTAAAGIAAPWVARAAEPEYRLKFGNIVSGDHPLNTSMANAAFRDKLVAAGFYVEWKKRYGEEAWALLEETTGKLG